MDRARIQAPSPPGNAASNHSASNWPSERTFHQKAFNDVTREPSASSETSGSHTHARTGRPPRPCVVAAVERQSCPASSGRGRSAPRWGRWCAGRHRSMDDAIHVGLRCCTARRLRPPAYVESDYAVSHVGRHSRAVQNCDAPPEAGLRTLMCVTWCRAARQGCAAMPSPGQNQPSSLNTRSAFPCRNFGHTSSVKGTSGRSRKVRSRARLIGKWPDDLAGPRRSFPSRCSQR